MIVRGIDVSRWQKGIDWALVALPSNDLRFAIVKIGGADDGIYTDPYGAGNLKAAVRAGMEVGAYWFFGPENIEAQAQRIESNLAYAGVPLARKLWIDLEGEPTLQDVKNVYTLIMDLRLRGWRAGIYTRANIWNAAIAADPKLPTPESLDIPLWVAHYKPPDTEGPIMPKGWSKWTAWQFSSKGRVPGIEGDVDMNLWDPSAPAVTPPTLEPTVYKVTASPYLNIRAGATTSSPIVGRWPTGTKVSGYPSGGWVKMPVVLGGAAPQDATGAPNLAYYSSEQWMEKVSVTPPPIEPPPVTTRKPYQIGVHVIGNMRAAEQALAAGAQVIFGMHDHHKMHQLALANPTKIFIYRGWIPGGQRPTPRDVFNQLQVGRDNPPNLWYVGTNENDHFGDDPEALRGRVLWDKDLFNMLKDVRSDIRYFGGSFGHGCPGGIEDPSGPVTAALMGYADLWNQGMGIDLHNYEKGKRYPDDPPSDALIHDPIWYPKRGDFWFKNGILDPRVGGGFIHGETGVEAGHGGYRWAGYNQQQFGRSVRTLREFGRQQIVVDSGPYKGTWPSVDVAGAIYQMGDTNTGPGGWGGYNIETYLPELQAFWGEG